ncbi:MAG: 23S rRNA (guanosine(2251)-2'-O)-methyltransferase RlmB [Bacteroidia bacterium]
MVIGFHAVEELLQGDRTVSKVFINQNADKQKVGVLRKYCKLKEVPMQMVPLVKLNKMSRANHQGVVAVISPIEYVPLEETVTRLFEAGTAPKILVADGIQDIKNIGAIARSCLAFDVDLLIMGTKSNAEIGDGAVKASAGALLRLPVARVKSLSECLNYLKSWGIIQIAASEKGQLALNNIHEKEIGGFALWMGNEDRGLSRERLAEMDLNVAIPMSEKIDSLNVSVAAGVILYELTRR